MKIIDSMNYIPLDNFVLRTPSKPLTNLKYILADTQSILKQFLKKEIAESIYIASPILYTELEKLINGKIADSKEEGRIISSFSRYLTRMCTRCTPFGLFAGCSVGRLGKDTDINLDGTVERNTRLDMEYLYTLYSELINRPEIKNRIKFFPNSTLYKVGNKYRYVQSFLIDSQRKYRIAEVESSKYLNFILKKAELGADLITLSQSIIDNEISMQEASDFVNDIISEQLLLGELNQSVSGDDFLNRLIILLEKSNADRHLIVSIR